MQYSAYFRAFDVSLVAAFCRVLHARATLVRPPRRLAWLA